MLTNRSMRKGRSIKVRSGSVVFLLIKQFRGRACSIIKRLFSVHHAIVSFWNAREAAKRSAGHLTSIGRVVIKEASARLSSPNSPSGWSRCWEPSGDQKGTQQGTHARGRQVLGGDTHGLRASADQDPKSTHFENADNLQGFCRVPLTLMAQPVGAELRLPRRTVQRFLIPAGQAS